MHNVKNAVFWAFCGHRYRYCSLGHEAWHVVGCETGYTYTIWSTNGQYKNIFQMGESERRTWGWHVAGSDPWTAAKAGYRMFIWTSTHEHGVPWHRWSCQP